MFEKHPLDVFEKHPLDVLKEHLLNPPIPQVARGRFPFNKPAPTLLERGYQLEAMLPPPGHRMRGCGPRRAKKGLK